MADDKHRPEPESVFEKILEELVKVAMQVATEGAQTRAKLDEVIAAIEALGTDHSVASFGVSFGTPQKQ